MLIPIFTSTKIRSFPVVVGALVVLNLLVFMIPQEDYHSWARRWAFTPADSVRDTLMTLVQPSNMVTLVTHAFLHAGWCHLLSNLWILGVFGVALESRIGWARFTAVYFLLGAMAVLSQAILHSGPARPIIGASGAISGVFGCYLAIEPRGRVLSLFFLGIVFFVTEIPSIVYAAMWLLLQLDGIQTRFLVGPEYKNIAWWAHLGGFAAGACVGLVWRLSRKTSTTNDTNSHE